MSSHSQRFSIRPDSQNIPERWLYWTYQNAEWLSDQLTDTNGRSIVLIDRGRRNFGDGPDFLDTRVIIDGQLCRGDIEFHVAPKDWYRHGHQSDRRYAQVILHFFWQGEDQIDHGLAARFPHVQIKDQLSLTPANWRVAMLAIEDNLLKDQGHLEIPSVTALSEFSEKRFLRRCDRFLEYLEHNSAKNLCYAAIAEALGYRQNQAVMFNLMRQVPASELQMRLGSYSSALLRFATLLIYSGLCPIPQQDGSPLMTMISERLSNGDFPLFQPANWRFGKVRPANRPVPRLAALAQLLPADNHQNIFQDLLNLVAERKPIKPFLVGCEHILRQPLDNSLQNAIEQLQTGRITPHFTFGKQRVRQFLVSGLLPLLWAVAARRGQPGFQLYIESLYEQCPGCESPEVIRRCFSAKTTDSLKVLIKRSAFYQQGVLEFFALRQGGRGNSPAY